MRRRDLLSLLGGAAVSWPMRARAQQSQRIRLVGVMTNLAEDDPETKRRLDAFKQHLQELGWREQDNIRFAYRWGVGDPDKHHRNAADLVALNADVILAHGNTIMVALRLATATIPIVFVSIADPVAGGFVASLSHPGGNATGFTSFEYAQSGKWVELLKELAPNVQRVAVAIGAAGVPLVEGHRISANRERSHKGYRILRTFISAAARLARRRAHGERARRHYHHLGTRGALLEAVLRLQRPFALGRQRHVPNRFTDRRIHRRPKSPWTASGDMRQQVRLAWARLCQKIV